jgi:predicted GIY-YIG superfamily endonuclease
MVNIYVLRLFSNKYYIGKTDNPEKRINEHNCGNGSIWTQKYIPLKLILLIPNCDEHDEDKYTIKYMKKYGIDNVRGGSFCELILNDESINTIKRMIYGASDKCFNCGSAEHYIADCNSTQYGYIDKKPYHINDIINTELLLKEICNKKGSRLELCNGPKIKPYFRRYVKESHNNRMTEWHKEWQSHFSDYTENPYLKISSEQIHNRRSDVDLNETHIIEFQHSSITKKEASERLHDYGLHNKEIIWIINGDNTIDVTNFRDGRCFLEFVTCPWKYESYIDFTYIYIDINDNIYKIYPSDVKSRMIEVCPPLHKIEFINRLKSDTVVYTEDIPYHTTIYVKQQGAGNGKTYGIVQLINDEHYEHYDTFVYLTKQHSAKHIIKSEIDDQIQRGLLLNIEVIDWNEISKKHIIKFNNTKTGKRNKIIIGTFDSFIYSLGNKNIDGVNKFIMMVQSIIDDDGLRVTNTGRLNYGNGIHLNKKLLLVGDEMQDLDICYMKAIIKITRDRYVDFYAVGDKLQSISLVNNAFTFLENELPDDIINIVRYESTNICRRFNNLDLINFVNHMIPFNTYNLPQINNEHPSTDVINSISFIDGEVIYATDTEEDKINNEVEKLMIKYRNEVNEYNRKPNDFLIVTPFVKKNPLVEQLHAFIRQFWKDYYKTNDYKKYSVFHKSEEGASIDLSESDNATRIVSIHSSKGDGRCVVFAIGFTESALKKYSYVSNNLIFNSLLHVGLTRMKEKLYFRCETNGDNIHKLISEYQSNNNVIEIEPCLKISANLNLHDLLQFNKEDNFKFCNAAIFTNSNLDALCENTEIKELIDMKHHCYRYASFLIGILLNIILYNNNNGNNSYEQPIYQILTKIKNDITIKKCNNKKYYKILSNGHVKQTCILPILCYSNGDYKSYSDTILQNITKITKIKLNSSKIELTPLTTITLYHLIDIYENNRYTTFPISDLYDIIDIFKRSSQDDKDSYKMIHYHKLRIIKELFSNFSSKYSNLKFLVNHHVFYNGKTSYYKLYRKFELIAYNSDVVIICYIKPQFNTLNYNETLLNSVYDTFIVKNVEEQSDNYERFNNKQILSCIFTFDNNKQPYYLNWLNNNNDDLIYNNMTQIWDIIKNNIIIKLKSSNNSIYTFYKYTVNSIIDGDDCDKINAVLTKYTENTTRYNLIKYPPYILKFFHRIERDIEDNYTPNSIIEQYMDKHFFIVELNKLIEKSISNYL